VTIARVDEQFKPIKGTEKTYFCDTVLIAVGLDPVNEFYLKAKEFGFPAYAAVTPKKSLKLRLPFFRAKSVV
jgi:hypothetical protein